MRVDENVLYGIPLPQETETYIPIANREVISLIREIANGSGYLEKNSVFNMAREGNVMSGVINFNGSHLVTLIFLSSALTPSENSLTFQGFLPLQSCLSKWRSRRPWFYAQTIYRLKKVLRVRGDPCGPQRITTYLANMTSP